jgi:hypothetical protein
MISGPRRIEKSTIASTRTMAGGVVAAAFELQNFHIRVKFLVSTGYGGDKQWN